MTKVALKYFKDDAIVVLNLTSDLGDPGDLSDSGYYLAAAWLLSDLKDYWNGVQPTVHWFSALEGAKSFLRVCVVKK